MQRNFNTLNLDTMFSQTPDRKLKLCVLPTCNGKRYDLVHKFPMNNERAEQWIDIIDLPELKHMPLDKVRKRFFICSKHFRPQDYKNCESRSLNTTAYPRLHLKLNEDEGSGLVNDDELQGTEYNVTETTDEITDIVSKTSPITLSTTKSAVKSPDQYVVCSTTTEPLMFRRNQITEPTAHKTVQSSSNSTVQSENVQRNEISVNSLKNESSNMIFKRKTDTIESVRKKINLINNRTTKTYSNVLDFTVMPAEKDGMIVINHEAIINPLKVSAFWLRDHCRCEKCYGETSQRKINIADMSLDIEPIEIKSENEFVIVTWPDGHESKYDIHKLNEQLSPKVATGQIEAVLWSADDILSSEYANVTLNDFLCNDDVAKNVVSSLIKFGCAFIKNVPANLQSTEMAVRRLFPIQKTHFGEMWSFSDNKAHNDTAYTNEALLAHNDNTYFSDAAGLQVLHCVSRAGVGGDNFLVDGFHVLKKLREQNGDAYNYLSEVVIPSEYIEDGYHFKHCAPVVIVDAVTNEPNQIRFNMNDRAWFNHLSQDEMRQFYKHYQSLAKEIQLKQNEWHFKLLPGTVCIFDNWRLLHGRTEYSGRRQMVGCYVARSEYLSVARQYGFIS